GLRCGTTPLSFQPWDHLTHGPGSPAARRSTAALAHARVSLSSAVKFTSAAPGASPITAPAVNVDGMFTRGVWLYDPGGDVCHATNDCATMRCGCDDTPCDGDALLP